MGFALEGILKNDKRILAVLNLKYNATQKKPLFQTFDIRASVLINAYLFSISTLYKISNLGIIYNVIKIKAELFSSFVVFHRFP